MPAPPAPGWVYILTNPAFPHMVKIGLTTKTPDDRAKELTGATGVPLPFKLEWSRAVSDCAYVEKTVHRMLDDKRVSGKREFFECDVKTARQVIEATAGDKLGRQWRSLPERRKRPGKGRGKRRRRENLPALLGLSAALLFAVLVLVRPPLPSWLPASVLNSFEWVESWRGP